MHARTTAQPPSRAAAIQPGLRLASLKPSRITPTYTNTETGGPTSELTTSAATEGLTFFVAASPSLPKTNHQNGSKRSASFISFHTRRHYRATTSQPNPFPKCAQAGQSGPLGQVQLPLRTIGHLPNLRNNQYHLPTLILTNTQATYTIRNLFSNINNRSSRTSKFTQIRHRPTRAINRNVTSMLRVQHTTASSSPRHGRNIIHLHRPNYRGQSLRQTKCPVRISLHPSLNRMHHNPDRRSIRSLLIPAHHSRNRPRPKYIRINLVNPTLAARDIYSGS